jgi:hypothetical protein
LQADKPALDAALAGAQAVEDDPKAHSVGFAGLGNAIGTVQLDACIMDGQTLACGGIAGAGECPIMPVDGRCGQGIAAIRQRIAERKLAGIRQHIVEAKGSGNRQRPVLDVAFICSTDCQASA